jgi:hypothetical protein
MSLTDIFSIPFLICLSICILLIGCSSIYFYQKISQQDHKISSMVSLISSLAEETQQNKNTHVVAPLGVGGFVAPHHVVLQNTILPQRVNNLIHVSDDEDESESEDSESESESESEESGSESDTDSEDNNSESNEYVNNSKNIVVSLEDLTTPEYLSGPDDLAKDMNMIDDIQTNDDHEMSYSKVNDHESDEEDDNSLFEVDELLFEEDTNFKVVDTTEEHHHDDDAVKENIKSIHLDQPSGDEITDFAIFKTINISSLDESNPNNANNASKTFETADYKKMSITKLREIISKQGVSDASKLKKNDILKMLGVE